MNPMNRHHTSGPGAPHHHHNHDMMYDTRKRQSDIMSPMGGSVGGGDMMNPNKRIRKNW